MKTKNTDAASRPLFMSPYKYYVEPVVRYIDKSVLDEMPLYIKHRIAYIKSPWFRFKSQENQQVAIEILYSLLLRMLAFPNTFREIHKRGYINGNDANLIVVYDRDDNFGADRSLQNLPKRYKSMYKTNHHGDILPRFPIGSASEFEDYGFRFLLVPKRGKSKQIKDLLLGIRVLQFPLEDTRDKLMQIFENAKLVIFEPRTITKKSGSELLAEERVEELSKKDRFVYPNKKVKQLRKHEETGDKLLKSIKSKVRHESIVTLAAAKKAVKNARTKKELLEAQKLLEIAIATQSEKAKIRKDIKEHKEFYKSLREIAMKEAKGKTK